METPRYSSATVDSVCFHTAKPLFPRHANAQYASRLCPAVIGQIGAQTIDPNDNDLGIDQLLVSNFNSQSDFGLANGSGLLVRIPGYSFLNCNHKSSAWPWFVAPGGELRLIDSGNRGDWSPNANCGTRHRVVPDESQVSIWTSLSLVGSSDRHQHA